jgi:hypothetical protein
MSVTISNLQAVAHCPPGSVPRGTDTTIKGVHSGKIKNNGAASVTCRVNVSIRDSDNHLNNNTDPFDVDAGQERSFNYETPLRVSYDNAGQKTVTARTAVDCGGQSNAATSTCNFQVV